MKYSIFPKMIHIPGGSFMMGSEEYDDAQPVHQVTVSDFYLAETPVTLTQYDYFCEQAGREKPDDEGWGRGNRPVINVSWEDAQDYCQWLSEQTGLNFRLPTEAEWEYAAGGGSIGRTQYAGTDSEIELGQYAWYSVNSNSLTHPVGQKRPNRLGLYDMSGNVWEWCNDWYNSRLCGNLEEFDLSFDRVYRGGSWINDAQACRVALRHRTNPDFRYNLLGFRVAIF